jgi:CDP-glucose 4,6-dehydratase
LELGSRPLEGLGVKQTFWRGRRVLLTGHTGFKGSWLSLVLARLGAVVTGYALGPEGDRSLFEGARVARHVRSIIGDIRDLGALNVAMRVAEPEVVVHLAAQSLVLTSYEAPLETFATNVLGTANVLEAARAVPSLRSVVIVTTDKVYKNREWTWPYREVDELGGRDPYSASKACAELVSSAYHSSFLAARGIASATARAGNVIGGGDWADNRIVPDFVRAVLEKRTLVVRNPDSTRPWQHLLEPLEGYLMLAEALWAEPALAEGAWNFGPPAEAVQPVRRLVEDLVERWGPDATWRHERVDQPHEAALLTLDSSKALKHLGWTPRLGYERGVELTTDWYKAFVRSEDQEATTLRQIDAWLEAVAASS